MEVGPGEPPSLRGGESEDAAGNSNNHHHMYSPVNRKSSYLILTVRLRSE